MEEEDFLKVRVYALEDFPLTPSAQTEAFNLREPTSQSPGGLPVHSSQSALRLSITISR
jgi:hypothetical protein